MPESSGVKSSPTRLVVSLTAFAPMLSTMPSLSSGRAVRMLIEAPMPPVAMSARPVLYTSTALMASAARFAKLKERELPPIPPVMGSPPPKASADGIWRPFRVTMLNCGPNPRAVTVAPSPLRRSIDTPVMRCKRFRQIGVRELADVFSVDRIDDADCIALGLHRSFQASAQTGDDHFFEFFARLFLSEHRIDEHCATNNGEQSLRGNSNALG